MTSGVNEQMSALYRVSHEASVARRECEFVVETNRRRIGFGERGFVAAATSNSTEPTNHLPKEFSGREIVEVRFDTSDCTGIILLSNRSAVILSAGFDPIVNAVVCHVRFVCADELATWWDEFSRSAEYVNC